MNRKAALLVILVFVLGVALGAVSMRVVEAEVWGGPAPWVKVSHGHPSKPGGKMGGPGRIIEQLTQEVRLTSAQQEQVASILEDTRKKYEETYTTIRPQMEQTRQEGRARIRSVLKPEQLPKFEEFLRRIDEERKNRERR